MAIIYATIDSGNASDSFPSFYWAYFFILFSAVADFLDGFCARLLRAYSNLGKQLDSLSDLVSFGVAPGILVFYTLLRGGYPQWTAWLALLIPLCGAIRLARFNIDDSGHHYFKGLPIPSAALFFIGFTQYLHEVSLPWWSVAPVVVFVALLMVMPLKLFSLKFTRFSLSDMWPAIALIIIAVGLLVFLGFEAFMWIIILYLILSICLQDTKFLK